MRLRRFLFLFLRLSFLLPAFGSSAGYAGFLGPRFVHDEILPDPEFSALADRVSPDSMASTIRHLQDYGTRYANTPQALAAGNWLLRRLWGFGYTDTTAQSVSIDGKVTIAPINVIARKPGTTKGEFRILVGGHYDSIVSGGAAPAAESAPGADDNGSGTAGALEIARVLTGVKLDATVEFVFFTAEELGLQGSLAYVRQLVREGVPGDKLFFINMDMLGNSDASVWKTRIYYDADSEPLARLLARVGEAYALTEPVLSGSMRRSDHASFWAAGYPAVFLHEMTFSPYYHTTEDLLEHLEMDYEAEVVKMALASILHLARSARPPRDVLATRTGDGGVLVTWSHSADADLVGYYVNFLGSSGDTLARRFTRGDSLLLAASPGLQVDAVSVVPVDVLGEGASSAAVPVSGARVVVAAVPNPTSGPCDFLYSIPGRGGPVDVTLRIFDAAGRVVVGLRGGIRPRGPGRISWDGKTPAGGRVPPGVYFFVLEASGLGRASGRLTVAR